MQAPRWEWTLSNRGRVTAMIDPERNTELVAQGETILSEAPRGTRPAGHTVAVSAARTHDEQSVRPPVEAVIAFDPRAPICVLRVDGHEVAPDVWPSRARPSPPAEPPSPPRWLLAAGALAIIAGATLFFTCNGSPATSRLSDALDGTRRAESGLFIAHFPKELEAKPATMPNGVDAVLLQDGTRAVTFVLAAVTPDATSAVEPWDLQQRLRDEALASLPKGKARFEEGPRRDDTCAGERGAVVTGTLMSAGTRQARVWTCAFVHDGVGYFTLYSLNEPADDADEKRARAVVDATELTRLSDLRSAPTSTAEAR